jgi:hypothetical protein
MEISMLDDLTHSAEIDTMQNASNHTIYVVKFYNGESVSHTEVYTSYTTAENAVKNWYETNKEN